ncbi:MAG TPA: long-chain fatty acid--CoA ligase [Desulfobulbaceae bacterium]|nr:long-chain fatty acid--CoA ligase [Desulfobulbaceae bacterium]
MSRQPQTDKLDLNASTCTIPGLLKAAAKCRPSAVFFTRSNDDVDHFSFEEIVYLTARTANALLASGVQRGDRVALLLPTCLEAVVLFYATATVGAVTVPMDYGMGSDTKAYILQHAAPCLVFCGVGSEVGLMKCGWPARQIVTIGASGSSMANEFEHWLEQAIPSFFTGSVDSIDPAVLLYTSGSTGCPKGVLLSHGALCRSGFQFARHYGWHKQDLFFNLAELHTMSGLRNTCITPLWTNSGVHLCPPEERRSVFEIIEQINRFGCSLLGGAPIFVRQLRLFYGRFNRVNLERLRVIFCTGALLDADLVHWIYDNYNIPVLNYYGLTETCGFCAGHSMSTFLEHVDGIGFPVDATLSIVDASDNYLPSQRAGELCVSSPNLMLGYYKQPEMTDNVLKNGCFHTGDQAWQTKDGNIVLIGRKKNFIKTALTELVYFEEVELALERHPQVREAGVCGFISGLGDERLAAFVATGSTVESEEVFFSKLQRYISQHLGTHKSPSVFYLLDRLPRTSSGKLLRKELELILQ